MPAKVCRNCQAENDLSAKFCYQCGNALPEQSTAEQICRSCGFANAEDAKFCAACGTSLGSETTVSEMPSKPTHRQKKNRGNGVSAKKKLPRQRRQKRKWDPLAISLILAGATLFVLYLVYMNNKASKVTDSYIEQTTNNVELENNLLAVASKFGCACGSCPKNPLETCTCATARKERDFIRNALYSGQSIDEVITVLNKEYGGLKAEYRSQYGSETTNLSLPSTVDLNSLTNNGGQSANDNAIASFANRMQIISHFTCSCGQCTMDELKDCDCDHPGGAKEVKQFIDQKINEGSFTVAELIELVENKYGGRIR